MEAPAAVAAILKRGDGVLIPAVEDLTVDELRAQPAGPDTNPIGWLAWHLTRVQDDYMSLIKGEPKVWQTGGWSQRFNNEGDPLHIAPEKVALFDPADADTLLGYYRAVRERTDTTLARISPEDFDRVLPPSSPARSPMTVMETLAMVISDNIQHIGQIAYLRGLLREQGWYERRRALK